MRSDQNLINAVAKTPVSGKQVAEFNKETVMELRECKFYHAGQDMNFAIFSDSPCLTRYLQSIRLPLGPSHVDVYEIQPGAKTQWIVVKHVDGDETALQIFTRQGEGFLENELQNLPSEMKGKIVQRFPKLRSAFPFTLA